MDAQAFWKVIGHYNAQTKFLQIGLLILVLAAMALSYSQRANWAAKLALGIVNIFRGTGEKTNCF